MDYSYYENFSEIAVLFSEKYSQEADTAYGQLTAVFPLKEIYLVSKNDVMCPLKCKAFQSYLIFGSCCPIHSFTNAQYHKIPLPEEYRMKISEHTGPVYVDSIYQSDIPITPVMHQDKSQESNDVSSAPILVVSENQRIVDYFNYRCEETLPVSDSTTLKNRMRYLMKENMNGSKIKSKKIFGVVYTHPDYEPIADNIVKRINTVARAYRIYLRDLSYERLISIDNIECLVLVDCPVFECTISLHIPVISPFSVECGFSDQWKDSYDRNYAKEISTCTSLAVNSYAGEIMLSRDYQGVPYRNDEENTKIEIGQKGIASKYEKEF
ncbi:hypothetical protein ENBRE01_1039 [Enteropsectra breve]|nr:hypothetical protein ENBRE01_1039 [Enteropsectra breve]